MLLEQVVKGDPHRPLRGREPGPLRIGGITHQRQDAFLPQLRKALQIDGVSEDRRVVHLEIPCVHHHPHRGIDGQGRRVHDAVVGLDELHAEVAQVDGLPELHHFPLRPSGQLMLLQLVLDDAHGEPGGIDGHIDFPEHIGKRPDMVLMAVGDHEALHLVDIVLQIGHIGNDKVNPQHIVRRERKAAVHHDNTVFVLERSNVHANLLQTPQRDYL